MLAALQTISSALSFGSWLADIKANLLHVGLLPYIHMAKSPNKVAEHILPCTQEKDGGLPVVLHERPGHLMLTSAFHDLADVGRLELQPLRSELSCSQEDEATEHMHGEEGEQFYGDENDALSPHSGAAPTNGSELAGSLASAGLTGTAVPVEKQHGRQRGGYNALQNGRNDSAADFGCVGGSASGSAAVSNCESVDFELLSVRGQGPDQARSGYSLAGHHVPDQEGVLLNSSAPAGKQASRDSDRAAAERATLAMRDSCRAYHLSAHADCPSACAATHSSTEHAQHKGHGSMQPIDLQHCHVSMPSAWQQTQHERPCSQQKGASGRAWVHEGLKGLLRGSARWCFSVPWSQVCTSQG